MRLQYSPQDVKFWSDFLHDDQIGAGFIGQPYQRGAGIGSFFRSLFRMAAPVLKRAAKAVGKQALVTGANVVGDIISGGDIAQVIETRGKEALTTMANKTAKRMQEAKNFEEMGKEDQEGSGAMGQVPMANKIVLINQPPQKKPRTARKPRVVPDRFEKKSR